MEATGVIARRLATYKRRHCNRVPNRQDPFLRPLLVAALSAVGLYDYGFEKSYSKRALRVLMTSSGFEVVAESSILFMPGGIRMLDLACHAWLPALTPLTAALVWPFAFLDRHWPLVRQHGYLIAAVGQKPGAPDQESGTRTQHDAPT